LPWRVAVVGSGYIAVELAGCCTRSAVGHAGDCHDALLRHFDPLLGEKLMCDDRERHQSRRMNTVALARKVRR
jgi:pyruvate/2-oxoglutarate dehydrogenase complex dihydrolipoamide dehydrogenase (E3) component